MKKRVLSVVIAELLICLSCSANFFSSCNNASATNRNGVYKLLKRIPVVCWHPEYDDRFVTEIEAAFVSSAETMNIFTNGGFNGNDTVFTMSDVKGNEYDLLQYSYDNHYTVFADDWETKNKKKNRVRRLMLETDSIFIVRLMDDTEDDEHREYQYFGVKRGGYYWFGRTDWGTSTWTFPEMIKKAFGSVENFRQRYMKYVERMLYGRGYFMTRKIDDLGEERNTKRVGAKKHVMVCP